MKKTILLLFFAYLANLAFSQHTFDKKEDAQSKIKDDAYETLSGWVIKEGDTILLGKGSLPDKRFAFSTEQPGLLSDMYSNPDMLKMPHRLSGKKAIVHKLQVFGTKKQGFYIVAVLKVGELYRYNLEIENAIDVGEVVVPARYAKKADAGTAPSSLADELKKLKELLDSGAITQEEYDKMKKKLLDN